MLPPVTQTSDESPVPVQPVLAYDEPASPSIIAVVGCRMVAIWMLATGLSYGCSYIANVAYLLEAPTEKNVAIVLVDFLPVLLWFAMGWYCWAKSPSLARRMARDTGEVSTHPGAWPGQLLAVLVTGVGVYITSDAIPILFSVAFRMGHQKTPTDAWDKNQIFTALIRIAIGVWLILGSGGIAALIRRHSGKWGDASPELSDKKSSEAGRGSPRHD